MPDEENDKIKSVRDAVQAVHKLISQDVTIKRDARIW